MKRVLLALLFLLPACVEIHPTRNSRYSVDITKLKPEELIKDTWVYRHPTKRPTDYNQFIFGSVTVYDNPAKKIKKGERPVYDALAERLTKRTIEDFRKNYTLVDKPAEGVLEIHIAIVDIKPIVNYINKDGNEAVKYDGTVSGTKFELDCTDSMSLEPILAISTLYKGEEYAAYANPAHLGKVEKAYGEWSRFFKNRFDEAMRAKQPSPK